MAEITSKKKRLTAIDFAEAARLGISQEEWKCIEDGLGRLPNEIEAALIAAAWSENVSYKSSISLLKKLFPEQDMAHYRPAESVGIVDLGDGLALAATIQALNLGSLTAEEQGDQSFSASYAVNYLSSDILGVGAEPLAMLNLVRLGDFEDPGSQEELKQIFEGLSRGANTLGIPMLGGELYFNAETAGSTVLNCAALGIIKTPEGTRGDKPGIGSPVILVGLKSGRDGLSKGETAGKHSRSSDPFHQYQFARAAAQAISKGLVAEFVDLGRGGLAAGIFDITRRINQGLKIELDKVPLAVRDLTHAQVLLSETPGRAVAVLESGRHREAIELFSDFGIAASLIGEVVDSDDIAITFNQIELGELPYKFFNTKFPVREYQLSQSPPMLRRLKNRARGSDGMGSGGLNSLEKKDEWSSLRADNIQRVSSPEELPIPENLADVWVDIIANPNLSSRKPLASGFDDALGGRRALGPGGDAALFFLPDSTGKNSRRGVAATIDSNVLYVGQDPYLGTVQTVAEGMRNLSAIGARPLGMTCVFNCGDPKNYREISALSESVRGLADAADVWKIPVVAERVSLGNFVPRQGVQSPPPPSVAVSVFGLHNDVASAVTAPFKDPGDLVFIVGAPKEEIGCSEYAHYFHKQVFNAVPEIDFEYEERVCSFVRKLISDRLIKSAHDISSGGLAVALTECAVSGEVPVGVSLQLRNSEIRQDAILFGESSGRFIVSFAQGNKGEIQARANELGIPLSGEGTVGGKQIRLTGSVNCEVSVSTVGRIWRNGLNHLLGRDEDEGELA